VRFEAIWWQLFVGVPLECNAVLRHKHIIGAYNDPPAAGYRDTSTAPLQDLQVHQRGEIPPSRSAGAGNMVPTRQRKLENVSEFDLSRKVGENAKLAGKVRNCTSLGRKCDSN